MGDSINGHAGIRILEIPDLRGISIDNYVSKMDIRCLKKCRKRNTLEDTRLKMQLRVDEKGREIFSNNLKVHKEATAKKLMKFRMAWDDLHPRQSPGRSLLQREVDLQKEGPSPKQLTLPKLPKSNTLSYSPKPNATILATESSSNTTESLLSRQNVFDEQVVQFMNAKWYSNRERANRGDFDRKIPLTLKQQRFLAKLQGLLDPKIEPIVTNTKRSDKKRSRLWVNLPYSMDGGATGDKVRQDRCKLDNAPFLELSPDKLSTSKKPDTMTTWIGLETTEEIEHFMDVRSKTVIEE